MSLVELAGFTYRYPGGRSDALDRVALRIDAGFTAVTGPSGGGKSTLLRVCNGLVPHFHGGTVSGRACVLGHDVLTTPTRRLAADVGFVFQDPELQSVYAGVERDVAFGLENLGVPPAQMRARIDEALQRTGIAALRRRAVTTLSGGERQRLALASVLALRPRLLVLDEPLSQLDDAGASALLEALDALARDGTAIVLAEHRLEHVLPRADRVIHVEAGRTTDSPARGGGGAGGSGTTRSGPRWGPAADTRLARWAENGPARLRDDPGPSCPTSASTFAPAWRLDGITAGPARVPVVADVDLGGCAGEVVALVGPNGGGKTTLLRTIAGLLAPLSGSVRRAPGRVAYLPQNPMALLHRPSVRAEIDWTTRHDRAHDDGERVLTELGLAHVASSYPRDLSTGERQRVALAAVLAGSPAIALLDEPTRGMDGAACAALCRMVGELCARGCAVVIATHDRQLVSAIAHRIVEARDGAVRERVPEVVA